MIRGVDEDEALAEIAAEERARREAQDLITNAVRRNDLDGRFAGIWVEDDERVLVIAVTADAEEIKRELRAIASTAMRVVAVEHSYRELDALAEAILSEAERLGVRWSAVGVDECANRVNVMLEDLGAPASHTLRRHFEGRPIDWEEGTVVAA
jgi:hypothetical protein